MNIIIPIGVVIIFCFVVLLFCIRMFDEGQRVVELCINDSNEDYLANHWIRTGIRTYRMDIDKDISIKEIIIFAKKVLPKGLVFYFDGVGEVNLFDCLAHYENEIDWIFRVPSILNKKEIQFSFLDKNYQEVVYHVTRIQDSDYSTLVKTTPES